MKTRVGKLPAIITYFSPTSCKTKFDLPTGGPVTIQKGLSSKKIKKPNAILVLGFWYRRVQFRVAAYRMKSWVETLGRGGG